MADLREKRQHLQSFLLRHGRIFLGRQPWTRAHARWLSELIFEHPAQYLVLREYRQPIEEVPLQVLMKVTRRRGEVSSQAAAPNRAAMKSL